MAYIMPNSKNTLRCGVYILISMMYLAQTSLQTSNKRISYSVHLLVSLVCRNKLSQFFANQFNYFCVLRAQTETDVELTKVCTATRSIQVKYQVFKGSPTHTKILIGSD